MKKSLITFAALASTLGSVSNSAAAGIDIKQTYFKFSCKNDYSVCGRLGNLAETDAEVRYCERTVKPYEPIAQVMVALAEDNPLTPGDPYFTSYLSGETFNPRMMLLPIRNGDLVGLKNLSTGAVVTVGKLSPQANEAIKSGCGNGNVAIDEVDQAVEPVPGLVIGTEKKASICKIWMEYGPKGFYFEGQLDFVFSNKAAPKTQARISTFSAPRYKSVLDCMAGRKTWLAP